MKALFKTFLRLLLWGLIAAAVIGGLYWLCLKLALPRNAVIAGAALALAMLLGLVLTRRIFVRRRRLSQIQKIVTLDPAGLGDDAPENRLIEKRWLRAVSIMRSSYLGRKGNPLYALPWYMVMGKTGAGKSSAIRYSGLNAMLTDVGPEEIDASTRNCDWHFFRESVIMDTAGRYAVPVNEAKDSAEWREFLTRLAKYRVRKPLNGLVIAVAADTLQGQGEHLLSEARCLRRRIDEIMRILGAKFPVYLMVTKIDLPAGLAGLLESLPEESKKQSLGVLVQSPDQESLQPIETQISGALRAFSDRLRNFCLYAGNPGDGPSPHRIMAWEEFRALMPALRAYAEEVFADNPYQETPLLRGIFLSSALRGQQENSRAFPALGALARRVFRVREKVGGVFLHDFFRRVLPADSNLYRPLAEYLRWRSSLRAMAYGAMLLATFGLSLMFYLSFQRNVGLLERMSQPINLQVPANMAFRLMEFEQRFRDEALLEREISGGALPSMGFNQATAAYQAYSDTLVEHFSRQVLDPIWSGLAEKLSRLTENTDDREFFIIASHYAWLYDLMTAAEQGKSFEDLQQIPAMPQAVLHILGLKDAPQLAPAVAYSVARTAYSTRDSAHRQELLRHWRASLAMLPEIKSYSLRWIVHSAGTAPALSPVRGEAFWGDSQGHLLSNVTLDPVFTKEGLAVTLAYLENLNRILADDPQMKPSTDDFLRWYATNYHQAWRLFALDFAEKINLLTTRPARGETIALMSTDRNPYFALILRMDNELNAIRRYLDSVPAWMDDLAVFARALTLVAKANPENEKLPLTQRLKKGVQDFHSDYSGNIDTQTRNALDMKAQSLAKDVGAYLDSLRALLPFTMSNAAAFSAIKEAMPNENNKNWIEAPITLALMAAKTMNVKLNPNPAQDSPIYALTAGPMNFFAQRLMNQASCQIQFMWEGSVLAKTRGFAPSQLRQNLFAAQGGLAREFADNTLEFMLHHTLSGYEPENLSGLAVPFTAEFLAFINSGLASYQPVRDEYGVTVTALPTNVNQGAAETPYAVELALHCAREKQSFVNYNSPASTRFVWQRNTCGDASLAIHFRSVTLNVLYAGENGFLDFLNDFQYGETVFQASDFPDQEAALNKLGVRDITLQYQFAGADELLGSHRAMAGEAPFSAAVCR